MNKKSWRICKLGTLILMGLLILGLFLPTLISTNTGNRLLFNAVKERYGLPGEIQAKNLGLSWFGPQKIEELSWVVNGSPVVSLDFGYVDASLFQLIKRKVKFKEASFDNLKVDFSNLGENSFLFERGFPKLYDFHLEFREINQRLFAKIQGKSEYQKQAGSIDLKFEINENQEKKKGRYKIKGNLKAFPLLFLDSLILKKEPQWSGILTEALGAFANVKIEEDKELGAIKMALNSRKASALLNFKLSDKGFTLLQDSVFKTALTPKFFEILLKKSGSFSALKLKNEAPFALTIDHFFYPWDSKSEEAISADGNFKAGPFEILETIKLGSIHFDSIEGQLTDLTNEAMLLKIEGKGAQNEKDVNFTIAAELPKARSLQEFIGHIQKNTRFHLETTSFPLNLIDERLSRMIGDFADIQADLDFFHGKGTGKLSFSTEKFRLEEAVFSLDSHGLQAVKPFKFKGALGNEAFAKLADLDIVLKNDPLASCEVENFFLPFDRNLEEAVSRSEIKLHFDLDNPATVLIKNEPLRIDWLAADFNQDIKGFSNFSVKLMAESENSSKLLSILDRKSEILVSGNSKNLISSERKIHLNLALDNRLLKLNLTAFLSPKGFDLKPPSFAQYTLTKKVFQQFLGGLADYFTLENQPTLHFSLSPRDESNVQNMLFSGNVKLDQIRIKTKKNIIAFEDIALPFEISRAFEKIKAGIGFSGKTVFENIGKTGLFRGKISFKFLNNDQVFSLKESIPKIKLYVENAPEELLAGVHPIFPTLINSPFNLDVNFEMPEKGHGFLVIKSEGKDFNLHTSLKINDSINLYEDAKSSFSFAVNSERLKALSPYLTPLENFAVQKEALLKGEVYQIDLPLEFFNSDFKTLLQSLSFGADLEIQGLYLKNRATRESLNFSDFLSLKTNKTEDNLHFKNLMRVNNKELLAEGLISAIGFSMKAQTEDLPIELSNYADLFTGVLGKKIRGSLNVSLKNSQGYAKADFKGDAGNFFLEADVLNRQLTLKKPLELSFIPNQFLINHVLAKFSNILGKLEPSQEKISLSIDPQGFSFPIFSENFSDLKISKGVFKANRQVFQNGSDLYTLLGIFNNGDEKASIWLTPIYFSVDKGYLFLQRFDFLLNNRFHLASWGEINLRDQKVDMTLGLTARALKEAFGVTGKASDFLVPIPIKGSLSNLKIEKKKAAAKISSLVAQSRGPQGVLVGAFLDLAGGSFDASYPEPTTYPFPWKEEEIDSSASPVINLEPVGKHIEKGVEKIEKGAKKIINKIFH